MTDAPVLGPARADDAEAISTLILGVQAEFNFRDYTEAGIDGMREACSPASIAGYLARGDVYFVARAAGAVVGVAGIRAPGHLTHNFVRADFQGRGLSRALWALARDAWLAAGHRRVFTLRATRFALPIYEAWGFEATGPEDWLGGVPSTPMRLLLDEP